jgi:uncharacterized protein (TIGR03083 family)
VSFSPAPGQIADTYAGARVRSMALFAGLDDAGFALPVAGTPLWNVRELLSHMVGGPVALLAGQFEGAGSAPWAQAQVEARRGVSAQETLKEWQAASEAIDAGIRAGNLPIPAAYDVLTHEQDLRAAIGAPVTPDPAAVRFLVDGFGARVEKVVAKAGLAPLVLCDPTTGWSCGQTGGLTAEASEREWARVLTGRRSNHQASSLGWSGDPAPYLDLLSPFGPLRSTDVGE